MLQIKKRENKLRTVVSSVVKIEILETEKELRELLRSSETQEIRERVQALYWLKSGQVQTTKAIASLIGKHRVTVSRWLSSYKAQGINALLTKGKSSGRKKKLSPSVEASLRQELIDEQGFSSYKEIQVWLRVVHDVKMSYTRTPNQKQFLC